MEKRVEKVEGDISFLKEMQVATQRLLGSLDKNLSKISDTLVEMQKENIATNIHRENVKEDIADIKEDISEMKVNQTDEKVLRLKNESKFDLLQSKIEPLSIDKKMNQDRWKNLPFAIAIPLLAILVVWLVTHFPTS